MTLSSENGFSIITALFILLVLAVLGGFMVTMSGVQSRTTLWALQGARAYHAASSGLEWGGYRALVDDSCDPATALAINGFRVTVRCQAGPSITEGGQTYTVFQLIALAEQGAYGNGDYVSRQLQARVTGAIP
ncbi:MAG: pilus assembly protein MshP [Syntrophotaleaceae bacterium]